jgi:hypothetical protein
MDDISTRVVDRAQLEEETTTPERVGADCIREGQPERNKEHPRVEVHAAEVRPGNEDEGDSREHKLEINHGCLREGLVCILRRKPGVSKLVANIDCWSWNSHEWQHIFSETHLVSPEDPTDQNSAEGIECHEGGVYGPFVLYPSGVQNHETRDALKGDERCGCKSMKQHVSIFSFSQSKPDGLRFYRREPQKRWKQNTHCQALSPLSSQGGATGLTSVALVDILIS